jgi:hypothetical protein
MDINHVGDLMERILTASAAACSFMVKPYSVIMECIKGMNYVICPLEREREREREREILLMTTPFSQQLAGLRVIIQCSLEYNESSDNLQKEKK